MFWQGQSSLGWFYIPFVGIQNPGPQKFWEVKLRALSRSCAFIVCVSSCLELFYTNVTQLTDICNYLWVKPHWRRSIARCVDFISRKTISYMYCQIDSVGSVMFVAWSPRHEEAHAIKALNLESALDFTLKELWRPGLWIPTNGIKSHCKVDWPCHNFNQGSTTGCFFLAPPKFH